MKNYVDMKHIVLDADDPLAKAMSDIIQTRKAAVVTKDGEYYGMIDSGTLKRLSDDPNVLKAGTMAVSAPVITAETTLLDICKLFFTSRFKALPLIDKKKIIGVVNFSDLLRKLADERLLEHHVVSEVMSRPGVRIDEGSSIAQAQTLMRKSHVRRLIVTKEGMLTGIISTYDMAEIMLKPKEKIPLLKKKSSSKDLSIRGLMQTEVATISQGDSLTEAARKMIDRNVASLVVVEGNAPVGVVTTHDILETVFEKDEPNIYVSGLYDENRELYPEVVDAAKKEIGKLERSGRVEYLSLHFKFHNKRCTVKARLMIDGEITNASASEYGVLDCMKTILKELGTITGRQKQSKLNKR